MMCLLSGLIDVIVVVNFGDGTQPKTFPRKEDKDGEGWLIKTISD